MLGSSSGVQTPVLRMVELCVSKRWFSLTPRFSKLQTFHQVGRLFGSVLVVHGHDGSDHQIQMMRHRHHTPNQALQRTRHERRGCNHCVPCAGSLSLGR